MTNLELVTSEQESIITPEEFAAALGDATLTLFEGATSPQPDPHFDAGM